jgi:ABC-type transport system involved in cytochrome c biogenesis permease subunit
MQYAQDAYGIPGTGASGMIASGMPIATGFTNPSMVGAMPGTYSQSPNPDMYAQNLGNWINAPVGAPMAAAASPTPQTGAVGPIATAAKWVMDRVNQARQGLGGLAAIGGLAPRPYSGGQLESIRSGISPSTFQGNQRFSHAGEH